jgi:DegV family protein with EDD domain
VFVFIAAATPWGGVGCWARGAAGVALGGGYLLGCAARAHQIREALRVWFAIDTFEFLVRGGRVGKAQAMVGSALKIKPILGLESEIVPVERVRTARRAFERMVDYLRSRAQDGADGWVVQHIQAPEEAARLGEAGREIFGREPLFVSEVGPVIGTHVGPGLLGVGGCPARLVAA